MQASESSAAPGTVTRLDRRGPSRGLARLLFLLCAGGLAILPTQSPSQTVAPARERSISQAWIEAVGRGLYVVVTDPHGRMESIADTGASSIPNFEMDSIPLHETPGPRIYGTHIVLEPDTGRYVLRVVCPEPRIVYLVTSRDLMADCFASDSMAIAARDTASWSIEYSPAARTTYGPCWIRIRQLAKPTRAPTAKDH
jgi:hypothetical protein